MKTGGSLIPYILKKFKKRKGKKKKKMNSARKVNSINTAEPQHTVTLKNLLTFIFQ